MLAFCMVTLTAGVLDSLNPVAIAQQFVLQGLVRRKTDILFFILGVGVTNFVVGILIYYGIASFFTGFLSDFMAEHRTLLTAGEIAAGVFCLAAALRLFSKKNSGGDPEADLREKGRSIRPGAASLFLVGVVFCGFELTSALPYFGYLAFLLNYSLPFAAVFTTLLVYNLVYSLPLILLYLCYSRYQEGMERFYRKMQRAVARFSSVGVPAALMLLGGFLVLYGWAGPR